MITKKTLIPSDINFLNHGDYLYSIDFRAISENMDYEIPAMRKYENLCPWIVSNKFVAVNENANSLEYPNNNFLVTANSNTDARTSVYSRLAKTRLDKNIHKLWVAIPHPDADKYCEDKKMDINFSFTDFLKLNDKITQKKLLRNKTPQWREINSTDDLEFVTNNEKGYIKRRQGSGGYTVFKTDGLNRDFNALFNESPSDWFFEQEIDGRSSSIQCVKDESGDTTIFGFSEQIIDNGRFYSGSRILPLDSLSDKLYDQLKDAIIMLDKLLKNYVGFFGLDFIIDKNDSVFILEANIRLTAATIPTLLVNMVGGPDILYKEDVNLNETLESDVILARGADRTGDIIRFEAIQGILGKYLYVDLKECANNPKQINADLINAVSDIVANRISRVVKTDFYNFWPHGWTLSLILVDSHCVVTSWFLEKRIFIDAFCCNTKFDEEIFKTSVKQYFKAKETNSNSTLR